VYKCLHLSHSFLECYFNIEVFHTLKHVWNFNITLCSPYYEMQSLISNGCVRQILFICCTYKEQMSRRWFYKNSKTNIIKFGLRLMEKMWYKIWLQIKRGKANFSSFEQTWPRPFIGDGCLFIIVSFAHPNLFNKGYALRSSIYPLLRLPPSSSLSQPRLRPRYGPRL
jgi:hypothetical protein